jgi:hypothetical protein
LRTLCARDNAIAGSREGIVTPNQLAEQWRKDAEVLDRYDAELAKVARTHADDLDAAIRSVDDDVLDLAQAARESGLSIDRLRHKVADGEIPNAGAKGAPRIRRGDLPIKKRSGSNGFDATARATEVLCTPRAP